MRKLAGRIFNSQKLCKEWVKTELERMVHTITKEDKDLLHEIIKNLEINLIALRNLLIKC